VGENGRWWEVKMIEAHSIQVWKCHNAAPVFVQLVTVKKRVMTWWSHGGNHSAVHENVSDLGDCSWLIFPKSSTQFIFSASLPCCTPAPVCSRLKESWTQYGSSYNFCGKIPD
jgi:hypothetical protein